MKFHTKSSSPVAVKSQKAFVYPACQTTDLYAHVLKHFDVSLTTVIAKKDRKDNTLVNNKYRNISRLRGYIH
jgi:hypothetical protein